MSFGDKMATDSTEANPDITHNQMPEKDLDYDKRSLREPRKNENEKRENKMEA